MPGFAGTRFVLRRRSRAYDARVRGMGCAFNHAMERTLYDRRSVAALARWRRKPSTRHSGIPSTHCTQECARRKSFVPDSCKFVLDGFWLFIEGWALAGRLAFRARGRPAEAAHLPRGLAPMKFHVQGSGTPVLFLHGIPTCGRLWDRVVAQLQGSFFLRGCGSTRFWRFSASPRWFSGSGRLRRRPGQPS